MKNLAFAGVMAGLVLVGACTTYDESPNGTGNCGKPATTCRMTAADWLSGWPAGTCPQSIARAAAEQLLSTSPECYRPRGYEGQAYKGRIHYSYVGTWIGALDASQAMGDRELTERLIKQFEPVVAGPMQHLQHLKNHVDFSIFGALPLAIYNINKDKRCFDLGISYADTQWTPPSDDTVAAKHAFPREKQQAFWEKGYTPQTRLWIDDMYMITILQLEAYRATGNRKYIDRAAKEMCLYLDELQIKDGEFAGLFYHAPDVPFFWGRGDGWMAAGMALVLKGLPEDSEYRPRILKGYRAMMAGLLKFQRADGMWSQLINEPETAWPESSGTAMFTFSMVTGLTHGWLCPKKYGPAARKAWIALCSYVDEYGNVREVCTGTGKRNDHQYYLDRPRTKGDLHGQAPLLWTAAALIEGANMKKIPAKWRPGWGATVTVVNPVGVPRTETVAVKWKDMGLKSSSANLRVFDVTAGRAIPHQNDADGEHLLFSVELQRFEKREYAVFDDGSKLVAPADQSLVCWCGYIPERMDDYAWENDRFGVRAYGPVIMEPPPKGQKLVSSGLDIFNKCVSAPVLEKWLKYRPKGGPSYHQNRGEGMDNYLVGAGRGCGGVGARGADGKWLYSANWSRQKTVQVGPVRCEFEIEYDAWGGLGRERRHVTLDRGQSFARMCATFESVPDGVLVGPGLDISAKRKHAGDMKFSAQDGWVANFEPQDGWNGSIMTAVALDPAAGPADVAMDAEESLHLLVKPCAEAKAVGYYAGANWTGQKRYTSACAWQRYVKDFAFCLRNPVKVTVKGK